MLSKILIKQMVDALVAKAEEGRGRLRKVLGSRQQTVIQRCPNGETLSQWSNPFNRNIKDAPDLSGSRGIRGTETSKYPKE